MFAQNHTLFHGPGGSPYAWLSMTNQINGDAAKRAGISESTILTVQHTSVIRTLAWQVIGRKALSYIVVPKLSSLAANVLYARWAYITYLSYTMDNVAIRSATGGMKGKAATIALERAAANITVRQTTVKLADPAAQAIARRRIRRRIALRAGAQLGLRAVPIIGYGLLAYDIYTLTAHGELMGVKIYESEEYVHHYSYPVL